MVIENDVAKKDFGSLCAQLDNNFGCLPEKVEVKFQKICQDIQQIKSFYQYYAFLGLKLPDDAALSEMLRTSISRSRKKRYHGYETEINELPKMNEQSVNYISSKDPFMYYDEAKKSFLAAADPKWK